MVKKINKNVLQFGPFKIITGSLGLICLGISTYLFYLGKDMPGYIALFFAVLFFLGIFKNE